MNFLDIAVDGGWDFFWMKDVEPVKGVLSAFGSIPKGVDRKGEGRGIITIQLVQSMAPDH